MPDFSMNIDYGKPQNQMSLGDIVQLARGAQAYQQAEQLNPIAQQKAAVELQSAQMKTQKEKSELNNYYKDKTRQAYGGLLADPDFDPKNPNIEGMKAKLDEAKDYLVNVVGVPEHESKAHEKLLKHMTDHGVQGAQRVIQTIYNGVQQGQQLSTQGEQLNKAPTYVNQGPAQVPIYTSPYQTGGANKVPSVALGIQPSERETLVKDPYSNNMLVVTKGDTGNITGSRAAPGGNAGGFQTLPPGETSATADAAKAIQIKAQEAARNVQQSQFNNNTIIGLADKALVGANAETLAKLGGGYAVLNALDTGSATAVDNRQKLGHQIALETANLAAGAGLNTDAARALGEKMVGTTEWTPDAIKSTARMNRALTTGTDMFNRGVNSAMQAAGNSPFAARDFQNKWSSQEQLVPTLQFVDALRNAKADPEGAKKAIDSVGGYGSEGYKDMLKRAGKLNDLITKGQ